MPGARRSSARIYSQRIVTPDDDASLVAAAQAGDRQALEQLLARHQPRLYAICRRLCGNEPDALDATQEALVAIVRGLGRFDGRARFSTWAYRVATNAALDELRRRGRRPVPAEQGRDVPSSRPGPEGAAVAHVDVDAALATLPVEFRAAVVLRDLCDLSYDEVAATLDIPPGTVRSRIARGRAALAALLSDDPLGTPMPLPNVTPEP